jgi:hypothetical protein
MGEESDTGASADFLRLGIFWSCYAGFDAVSANKVQKTENPLFPEGLA